MDSSVTSTVYTAGRHDNAGIGRRANNDQPNVIHIENGGGYITHIALGWKHGHLVISNQYFYSWGLGDSWRLATGKKDTLSTPTLVTTFPENYRFAMVVAGDKFGAALGEDGSIYVWGAGFAHSPTSKELQCHALYIAASQKTLVAALEDGSAVSFQRKLTPTYVQIPGEFISVVAASSDAFVCVCKSGKAYTWSSGVPEPALLSFSENQITRCFAYQHNYFFVDSANSVFCYGGNEDGSLGVGESGRVEKPKQINRQFDSQVIQIAVGDDFALILTADGKIYGAGNADNNRTLLSESNRQKTKSFTECDLIKNKHVTQIAAGCFTSAILVDGALPPRLFKPYKTIEEFPVPEERCSMLVGYHSIFAGPNAEVFGQKGIQSGDILRNGNDRIKVLGISDTGNVVAVNSALKIIEIDESANFIEDYVLESRKNAKLETFTTATGKRIVVDLNEEPLIRRNGMKLGDVLEDGVRIVGTRGDFIFGLDKEYKLVYVDAKGIQKISRNGKVHKMCNLVGNRAFILETTEETGVVCCSDEFGVGQIAGNAGSKLCIKYALLNGVLKICEENITRCRKKGASRELFTKDLRKISVSIDKIDIKNMSIFPFDYVQTPGGCATVAGFEGDKVAVWMENSYFDFGLVELFEKVDVKVLGRLFESCILEDGVDAGSLNLEKFRILPRDEIVCKESKDKRAVVRGTKGGFVVLHLIDENKDIEVQFGNDVKIKIVKRHMMVPCKEAEEGSAFYRSENPGIKKI